MPRTPNGNAHESHGSWFARVTLAPGKRKAFKLPTCSNQVDADARALVLAGLAAKLRAAGHVDSAEKILQRAAEADAKNLEVAVALVQAIAVAPAAFVPVDATPVALTFGELARRWTSGELAREFKGQVRELKRAAAAAGLLAKHVLPIVGSIPVDRFTVDDAQRVLASLPPTAAPGSCRQIAGHVRHLLALAAWPLRAIPASPIPRGWMPMPGKRKAFGWLYPREDAVLLACSAVPLPWRVFYGLCHREGFRGSEACGLTWGDVDLTLGAVTLDRNKSKDPRSWALNPGCVAALVAWKGRVAAMGLPVDPSARVLLDDARDAMTGSNLAKRFRQHLRQAGVTRGELHARTPERRPIRAHDLRAGFITIALAMGRSEAWISDRTGHRSSAQIHAYKRAARSAAELAMGDWIALDVAIPELRPEHRSGSGSGSATGGQIVKSLKSSAIAPANVLPGELDASPNASPPRAFSAETETPHPVSAPLASPAAVSGGPAAVSPTTPPHPRAAIMAHLGAALGAALAAGDLDAARELNATLAALLAPTPASTSTSTTTQPIGADVLPFHARRAR